MNDPIIEGIIAGLEAMRLNLEDNGPFQHALSENLRSEDIEKWINIGDDVEVQEKIIDELEKNKAMEREIRNIPVVSKHVEMLEVRRSLSKAEVLSHCTRRAPLTTSKWTASSAM